MKRLLLLLTVCTMCISGVWARSQTIDGKVVDASTKSPPKAIPVAVQGSNIGSITSVYNGFAQESANGASLVISSVGFGGPYRFWGYPCGIRSIGSGSLMIRGKFLVYGAFLCMAKSGTTKKKDKNICIIRKKVVTLRDFFRFYT